MCKCKFHGRGTPANTSPAWANTEASDQSDGAKFLREKNKHVKTTMAQFLRTTSNSCNSDGDVGFFLQMCKITTHTVHTHHKRHTPHTRRTPYERLTNRPHAPRRTQRANATHMHLKTPHAHAAHTVHMPHTVHPSHKHTRAHVTLHRSHSAYQHTYTNRNQHT